ncbi:MAG: 3-dehydroquinate synthase [Coriobacteriaceae bacterium]|jgi:3-dehydroquinate synthase|nr:3-dehydroquinate synthase [Coriobacteriaceae bacterium]
MATTKIIVNLPGEISYDVRIGEGLLEGLGTQLRSFDTSGQALVLTDTNVAPLYLARVKESLKAAGYKTSEIRIPAGEESKSLECMAEIWEAMAQAGLGRDSLVLALGGGVVGDMAGFAAATYLRGLPFVAVPTTLLAMVDSSVGGKAGVNLSAGKNLVGAFKQPRYVCASTDTLASLSEAQWACGCAEIAKSAVICSDEFYFWLEGAASPLARREGETVAQAIARSVVFKADVVAADEFEEKGLRECLNYGHTLGHAIEALAGYGTFSHGAAVAEGMRFAARLGAAVCGTPLEFVEAQDALLDTLGLPALPWAADPRDLLEAMRKDKKVRGGEIRFVVPRDVGDWELAVPDPALVEEHLQAWAASKAGNMPGAC